MTLASVTAIVGMIGVIVSVLILAWQTLQLTRQVAVANTAATYSAHAEVTGRHHEICGLLLANQRLQPYFLDGKPCPPGDPNRSEALMVAGMIADVHDLGLQHTRKFSDAVHQSCWPASARESLKQPILNEVFLNPRPWWPELRMFFDDTDRAELPTPDLPPESPEDVGRHP